MDIPVSGLRTYHGPGGQTQHGFCVCLCNYVFYWDGLRLTHKGIRTACGCITICGEHSRRGLCRRSVYALCFLGDYGHCFGLSGLVSKNTTVSGSGIPVHSGASFRWMYSISRHCYSCGNYRVDSVRGVWLWNPCCQVYTVWILAKRGCAPASRMVGRCIPWRNHYRRCIYDSVYHKKRSLRFVKGFPRRWTSDLVRSDHGALRSGLCGPWKRYPEASCISYYQPGGIYGLRCRVREWNGYQWRRCPCFLSYSLQGSSVHGYGGGHICDRQKQNDRLAGERFIQKDADYTCSVHGGRFFHLRRAALERVCEQDNDCCVRRNAAHAFYWIDASSRFHWYIFAHRIKASLGSLVRHKERGWRRNRGCKGAPVQHVTGNGDCRCLMYIYRRLPKNTLWYIALSGRFSSIYCKQCSGDDADARAYSGRILDLHW